MSGMPPDADERTHEPSDKRKADFRKRGEIALSKDMAHTASLAGGAIALAMTAPGSAAAMAELFTGFLQDPTLDLGTALDQSLHVLARCCLPVLAGTVIAFLIAAAVQLGWPPTLKGISFSMSKVVSVSSLGELLSPKAIGGRLGGSFIRLMMALGAGAASLVPEVQKLAAEPVLEPHTLALRLGAAAARIAMVTGGVLAVLSAYDYLKNRRQFKAKLRMTAAEAKREHREAEGDPHVKAKRRRMARAAARRRLVSAVKGADVVLVNPTHVAVALRYRKDEGRAPKVVAKGKGAVAQRIRELAREAGVPIVPSPPLARTLHKLVREGAEVPASVFHAVAEVLAYVYRLRRRRA
jgi:flagellar biosynthetic protein FlhB